MDIVTRKGNQVTGTIEEHCPVVVSVAGRGPAGLTVELVVGDGKAPSLVVSRDDHLAADERELAVVDPDEVSASESDCVSTPDVLGVELGDVHVLDDDVGLAVGDSETLSTDDTGAANSDNGPVECVLVICSWNYWDIGILGVGAYLLLLTSM